MEYPVTIAPDDNDSLLVTFADVPEAITFGRTEAEALDNAADALAVALTAYIQDRRDVPAPSPPGELRTVRLGLLGELKIAIYKSMRERGWRKADLSRALDMNPRQVDRLLDLRHASTVAQLEAALAACGQWAEVELHDLIAA